MKAERRFGAYTEAWGGVGGLLPSGAGCFSFSSIVPPGRNPAPAKVGGSPMGSWLARPGQKHLEVGLLPVDESLVLVVSGS